MLKYNSSEIDLYLSKLEIHKETTENNGKCTTNDKNWNYDFKSKTRTYKQSKNKTKTRAIQKTSNRQICNIRMRMKETIKLSIWNFTNIREIETEMIKKMQKFNIKDQQTKKTGEGNKMN